MGYMQHHAIIVTSWKEGALNDAADKAKQIGLEVLGPSSGAINGERTFLVCPDGSKEGWADSDEFDLKRARFLIYLNLVRYEDGSSPLSWVELTYSPDADCAKITYDSWNGLPETKAYEN